MYPSANRKFYLDKDWDPPDPSGLQASSTNPNISDKALTCYLPHACLRNSLRLKVLAWISAGSGLARCELCTGGLGVGMSLHYSALISARSVDHTLSPKP